MKKLYYIIVFSCYILYYIIFNIPNIKPYKIPSIMDYLIDINLSFYFNYIKFHIN